jgi:hypothetical protein
MSLPSATVACILCDRRANVPADTTVEGVISLKVYYCASCRGNPQMVLKTIALPATEAPATQKIQER